MISRACGNPDVLLSDLLYPLPLGALGWFVISDCGIFQSCGKMF